MANIRTRILPSGAKRYLAEFRDQNGKRRFKQFERRKDADAFMVGARTAVARGEFVADADSGTVKDACEGWLAAMEVRRDAGRQMEAATLMSYRPLVRLHILDPEIGIGGLKLNRVARADMNGLRDRLLDNGRSEDLVRRALTVSKLIFDHARDLGILAHNPAAGIRVLSTSRTAKEIAPPTKEDVRRMIDAAPEDLRSMLVTAIFTGLRASETRGLRWCDVDFEEGYVHVRQRADRFSVMGEPKSKAGKRSVPIGRYVMNALKEWKLACPKSNLDLVFPTKTGAVRDQANIMRYHFKPLCRELGINIRWHDLRHFAISTWIEQGFNVKAIQTFAGHASTQLTMDRYGHLFPSRDHHAGMDEVVNRLLA